jgi:tetratricopeptide (TPR) repeat protein
VAAVCADNSIQLWNLDHLRDRLAQLNLPFPELGKHLDASAPPLSWISTFDGSIEAKQDWHWSAAEACYKASKWLFAESHLNHVLERDQRDWKALIYRGSVYANTKRWPLALRDYQRAISIEEHQAIARAWHSIGILQLKLGLFDDYRLTCTEVLQTFEKSEKPDDTTNAVRTCTLAPNSLDDYELAISIQKKVAEQHPTHHRYVSGCGAILYRAGEYQQALDYLNQAEELLEGHASDSFLLAMVHYNLGHRERAAEYFAKGEAWLRQHEATRPSYWGDWLEYNLFQQEAEKLILHQAEP